MKNKKGIGIISMIILIALGMLVFYAVLYLPIPAFTRLRVTINYFLILISWVLLQVFIIAGYYKLGFYAVKGFNILKFKFARMSIDIRNYIVVHT